MSQEWSAREYGLDGLYEFPLESARPVGKGVVRLSGRGGR